MDYWITIFPIALIILIIVKLFIETYLQSKQEVDFKKRRDALESKLKENRDALESKLKENSVDIETRWDLARVLLEQYMNQNLTQLNFIFWLSVIIVLFGFNLIVNGINKIVNDPGSFEPAVISAVSGILVDFIGATFFFLYRTTISQAKEYVLLLERLSSVGLSIHTLGRMADGTFKNHTTAELLKQITLPLSSQKK